ncbi:MAG: minor capsid protein [Acidaminococcaceae bacterium]|nr:minor capsid protein [Acidaminococcaceae bacterium]MBQ1779753.1 minor capsid protein [Acidaminococcaceae bacterium]
MSYPVKVNGYLYSPGTKAGFLRMKRQGIPRPLFSIQDKLAAILRSRYRTLTRKLLRDLRAQCRASNITLDAAPEDDSLDSLLKFFDEMKKEMDKQQEENEKAIGRINLNTVANTLEHQWLEEEPEEEPAYFVKKMDDVLKTEQKDYLKRLLGDADGKTAQILQNFAIDKKQFFEENMAAVRKLYLDNSIQRIQYEEMDIKRRILQKIIDYATGKTDTLEISELAKETYTTTDSLARLFARDQMQRFNKACTLSTFRSAGVTKVKWVTVGDVRVRKSHKALNGQIFDVNNLPKEVDDYNCRCGLVPVEWAE